MAASLVCFAQLDSDRKALLSNVAAAALVAVGLFLWEQDRRHREQEQMVRRRRQLQRILTTYPGSELWHIAHLVNLNGVISDGSPVTLFADPAEAITAFEHHTSTESVLRALLQRRDDPGALLTINAWDCVERFYDRLSEVFPALLMHAMQADDHEVVDGLLDVWHLRTSHQLRGQPLWKPGTRPGWIQNLTDNKAQWSIYIALVGEVLLAYAELLPAVSGVPSGLSSRRHE